jgi:glycosyltransferase involved in cell wall biosynthesis
LRLAHLTTVDMSLALLLPTELAVDVEAGLETFGISAPGVYVDRVRSVGVQHVAVESLTRAWDLRRDAAATREIGSVLRRLRLDVLHTHNPKTGVLGRILGRLARIPVVVNTCHGLWAKPDDPWHRRSAVCAIEGFAAQASHAELFQNDEDRRALRMAIPARRSRTVGNGTDLSRFRPCASTRRDMRRMLGVSDDVLLVGGAGRLVAEKGIAEFAAMATRLAGKATFVWAGPRDPDKADALDATGHDVDYVGEIEDMPAFYNALDVFVLPSYREGFSRSAMEAAACEKPMVLSDIRGCREIGRHETELLLVPPGDAASLTTEVDRLLRDVTLRASLAAAARRRALAHFDQRAIAVTSLQTYAEVARRRRLGWQLDGRVLR